MKISTLILACALPFAATAQAAINYDLSSPDAALELNHQAISARAIDVLYQAAVRGDTSVTRTRVASRLVENHLLGDYAHATYSNEQLFDGQRVGFRHDIEVRNELIATFRAAFRMPLRQAMASLGGDLGRTVTKRYAVTPAQLDQVFGSSQKMLLEYKLDAAHEDLARQVPLLAYRFPGGRMGVVSLYDIYACQNVQGRVMIYNRDVNYLQQQAGLMLESRFVMDWVEHASGLHAPDIAFIRQAIEDRVYRDGLTHFMGLDEGAEEGTPYLVKLAGEVTPEQVHRYYEAHKDQFKQIDKVRASHIEVATEADAKAVGEALAKGRSFADVARQYSIADDKAQGGDLGWIVYTKAQPHRWIEQLAFIQQPGTVSRPVRTPPENGVAHWEIVKVDERAESYFAPDSHEVHFAAADALAHQQAAKDLVTLKQKLLAAADIRANPQWLPANSLQF